MQGETPSQKEGGLHDALTLRHPLIYIMIPMVKRDTVSALWAYDAALTRLIQGVNEPSLQVMRLIWWRDQILKMVENRAAPAHPILQSLIRIDSEEILEQAAALADHWADFVEADPLDVAQVDQIAQARGSILFSGTARLLGAEEDQTRLAEAGRYWALVDIASHISDAKLREKLWGMAREAGRPTRGLPKPLGALVTLATARARQEGRIKPLAEQAMLLRFAIFGR